MTTTNKLINIKNKSGKIKLNDTVHKDSADQLIDELEKLYGESAVASNMQIGDIVCCAENAIDTVDVEINSPGGNVMEGQRIYNALKGISSRGIHVITTVSGLAASMGSVILMAGDERKMTHGSRIMIHEASMMAYGNAGQLDKQAKILESISSEIAGIYAERTNGTAEEIREMMKDETWMSASDAESNGFIDTIIKDGKDQNLESDPNNELKSDQSITTEKLMFTKDKDLVNKLAATKSVVAEHEATIEKLQAEMVTLTETSATLQTDNSTQAETIAAQTSQIETLETDQANLTTKLEESEGNQADFDSKVSAAAASTVAELGHPEPLSQTDNDGVDDLLITREAFSKMSPYDKTSFSKNGGKIIKG